MSHTIEELINDGGYPVYAIPDMDIIVTWSGSGEQSTFLYWRLLEDGKWDNYNLFTCFGVKDIRQAEAIAKHEAEEHIKEEE